MVAPTVHDNADAIAARIIEKLDGRVVLGLPLGLGKANRIANALFRRAMANRLITLDIFAALTLEPPTGSSDMEKRFVGPLSERLFARYERLDYARAIRDGRLPENITVSEFFLLAGRWLSVPQMQQTYVSANYTHAARVLLDRGVNVIAQLVAKRGEHYSLSCNSDMTLDLLPTLRSRKAPFLLVGEVSAELPFMGGEAALPAAEFDQVLETPGHEPGLFALPKEPVSAADHAIGIHTASLVKDGGTIQIGIGSLGDALTAALIMRHRNPQLFAATLSRLCGGQLPEGRDTEPFTQGLYAASEMFVDGFMELYREGILKRKAADGAVLHSGFFLGSAAFYQFLRDLPDGERDLFQMRGISFVNELLGGEEQKRTDRVNARFVNNTMMATLLGAVISDGLDDGRIVSGVGGQYNFVAQAFALEGARSIITLNATRTTRDRRESRLLWSYGHTTIPRHLRDIVITEYGVADLRGKSDRTCVMAMLGITDAQFQTALLKHAQKAMKIEPDFTLTRRMRGNTPESIESALGDAQAAGWCARFPFGTVFTQEEQNLLPALSLLRNRTATTPSLLKTLASAMSQPAAADTYQAELARMKLDNPSSLKERIYQRLLVWALRMKTTTPARP